jgi:hypothetical protein
MATAYTSDKKIGALDPITGTLSNTDEIVVNKGGDTLKATVGQVEEAVFSSKTSAGSPQSGDVVVVRRGSLIRQLETQNLIPDGAITKEKIASLAGIEDTKLAKITTAGKVGGGAIIDGTIGGSTAVNTSGAITTSGALSAGSGTVGGALTVSGVLTASGGVAGSVVGNVTGNASTATKLSSGRTFELTGDVTGSVSSDLTSGASIAASIGDGTIGSNKITNAAVTEAKLASSVAGNGLTGGAGTALAVNVDDATLEINTDALRVKDLGIGNAKLADSAVTNSKVSASAAIAGTKISPAFGSQNISTTGTLAAGATTITGALVASGDITAFSDARTKTDVETITSALELVSRLRGVRYTKDGKRGVGVIAQEVQSVLPEVVVEGEQYLSVAYGNLVGLLIEAIKELNAKIK